MRDKVWARDKRLKMTNEQRARITEMRRKREDIRRESEEQQKLGRRFLRRWLISHFPFDWNRSSPRVAWDLVDGARFLYSDLGDRKAQPQFLEVIRWFDIAETHVIEWASDVSAVTKLSNICLTYEADPPVETLIVSVEANWLLEYPVGYAYEPSRICFGYGDPKWRSWNEEHMPSDFQHRNGVFQDLDTDANQVEFGSNRETGQ